MTEKQSIIRSWRTRKCKCTKSFASSTRRCKSSKCNGNLLKQSIFLPKPRNLGAVRKQLVIGLPCIWLVEVTHDVATGVLCQDPNYCPLQTSQLQKRYVFVLHVCVAILWYSLPLPHSPFVFLPLATAPYGSPQLGQPKKNYKPRLSQCDVSDVGYLRVASFCGFQGLV